jgi:hypothetical protein
MIYDGEIEVVTAAEIENLTDEELSDLFARVTHTLTYKVGRPALAAEIAFIDAGVAPEELTREEIRIVVRKHRHWYGRPGEEITSHE